MTEPYYQDDAVTLHSGDCLDVLRELPDASVDAVVTDPPYGLEFMGKDWDAPWKTGDGFRRSRNPADVGRDNAFGRASRTSPEYIAGVGFQEWCAQWAAECLRVLKPGGHLLAFGGTRTYHRLAAGIEDAGFEIRDSITWLYASGFPKSLDVSKAITAHETQGGSSRRQNRMAMTGNDSRSTSFGSAGTQSSMLTAPSTPPPVANLTDAARAWQGWGTALKPAQEPIVVARKPLAGTVAGNVLAHGTGALNIDATRVQAGQDYRDKCASVVGLDSNRNGDAYGEWTGARQDSSSPLGRWPANLVLSHASSPDGHDLCADGCVEGCPVRELDQQSGNRPGAVSNGSKTQEGLAGTDTFKIRERPQTPGRGDSGGASRFFPTFRYEPKAPTAERPRDGDTAHPTVKPLDLMRWLVRLVTPPGGTVLEPFAGSGTTAEACVLEGFHCIAIEREPAYLPLIVARLTKPLQPGLFGETA